MREKANETSKEDENLRAAIFPPWGDDHEDSRHHDGPLNCRRLPLLQMRDTVFSKCQTNAESSPMPERVQFQNVGCSGQCE
jgi:hypothetical protein